jgi:hypothetical protein
MDAEGNRIWYREEIKPKTVKPEPDEEEVRYRSDQQIFDYVGNAEADHGTVHVVMEYTKTKRGPVLEVVKVEGSTREILPVLITDYQSERVQRIRFGNRAKITVRKIGRPDGTIDYIATRLGPGRQQKTTGAPEASAASHLRARLSELQPHGRLASSGPPKSGASDVVLNAGRTKAPTEKAARPARRTR